MPTYANACPHCGGAVMLESKAAGYMEDDLRCLTCAWRPRTHEPLPLMRGASHRIGSPGVAFREDADGKRRAM